MLQQPINLHLSGRPQMTGNRNNQAWSTCHFEQTRASPRNNVLVEGAQWRHLANTVETSLCSGNECVHHRWWQCSMFPNYFKQTCYHYLTTDTSNTRIWPGNHSVQCRACKPWRRALVCSAVGVPADGRLVHGYYRWRTPAAFSALRRQTTKRRSLHTSLVKQACRRRATTMFNHSITL